MAGEIDEARHVGRDVLEGLCRPSGFHETLRHGVVVGIATRGALQTLGYFLPWWQVSLAVGAVRSIVVTGASRT